MQLRATKLTAIASAVKRAFNISSLFSGGAPGVWYDPSDRTTLFQDSAGTTPVTAVEQPVGLMLDKSQGLVLGPELVTNGDFSNGTTGWTANGNTLTVSSEKLSVVGNNWSSSVAINVTIGKTYVISFDFQSIAVNPNFRVGYAAGANAELVNVSATQLNAKRYVTPAFSPIYVNIGGGSVGSSSLSDNISVRELPGNHAFQSTAASRPVLSARYNLLTKTEQFDDAAWTKFRTTISANAAVAPNGTTTADKMVEDANTNSHVIDQNGMGYVTNAQNTITVYAKESERKYLNIAASILGAGTNYFVATFDVSAGTVTKSANAAGGTLVSTAITLEGNGWYKCVVTGSFNTGSQIRLQVGLSNSSNPTYGTDGGVSYTGDGTSGIFIWGASLVPANQSTLPYQRVNTATDYNTVGFLPYLKFDGVDDSLSTNSINFTSTDKMSVFAGVRKLSGSLGFIAELSSETSVNNGSFYVVANNGTNDYGMAAKGTSQGSFQPQTYVSPITNVLTASYDFARATLATEIVPRVNGVVVQTVPIGSCGTGNFGNYPLYIGRRGGTTLPFNGQLYSMIIVGKAVQAGELSSAEKYVNTKTGAY